MVVVLVFVVEEVADFIFDFDSLNLETQKRFCSVSQHREIPMGVVDNTWHHVCVTWKARATRLKVYKDGKKKYSTKRFWSHVRDKEIEGKYCYPY